MDRFERVWLLDRLLSTHRYGLTTERLMQEAQCSRTTLYRDLELLRDTLGAPLENDGRKPCTWRYAADAIDHFQLPGVWLGADAWYALLLAQKLVSGSGAGALLGESLGRLPPRLQKMLGDKALQLGRLRVLITQARKVDDAVFRVVADAVLARRQLRFGYVSRTSKRVGERAVSPLRMTHYRSNWYLDAWDEDGRCLRSYALELIRTPQLKPETARDLEPAALEQAQGKGYGILSGAVTGIATIRFSAHAASWVKDELWHPQQQMETREDGSLDLSVPYSDPTELLMDVLRYGADAEVLRPASLRRRMREMLVSAVRRYGVEVLE